MISGFQRRAAAAVRLLVSAGDVMSALLAAPAGAETQARTDPQVGSVYRNADAPMTQAWRTLYATMKSHDDRVRRPVASMLASAHGSSFAAANAC